MIATRSRTRRIIPSRLRVSVLIGLFAATCALASPIVRAENLPGLAIGLASNALSPVTFNETVSVAVQRTTSAKKTNAANQSISFRRSATFAVSAPDTVTRERSMTFTAGPLSVATDVAKDQSRRLIRLLSGQVFRIAAANVAVKLTTTVDGIPLRIANWDAVRAQMLTGINEAYDVILAPLIESGVVSEALKAQIISSAETRARGRLLQLTAERALDVFLLPALMTAGYGTTFEAGATTGSGARPITGNGVVDIPGTAAATRAAAQPQSLTVTTEFDSSALTKQVLRTYTVVLMANKMMQEQQGKKVDAADIDKLVQRLKDKLKVTRTSRLTLSLPAPNTWPTSARYEMTGVTEFSATTTTRETITVTAAE
ncbi:MAG: hypothetical protein AAGG99_01085 [Pseudomonadota bacterium]